MPAQPARPAHATMFGSLELRRVFSSLGERKKKNLVRLYQSLRTHVGAARVIEEYLQAPHGHLV
jgi:hypothetical protein